MALETQMYRVFESEWGTEVNCTFITPGKRRMWFSDRGGYLLTQDAEEKSRMWII